MIKRKTPKNNSSDNYEQIFGFEMFKERLIEYLTIIKRAWRKIAHALICCITTGPDILCLKLLKFLDKQTNQRLLYISYKFCNSFLIGSSWLSSLGCCTSQ
jgi:hypothetical protein